MKASLWILFAGVLFLGACQASGHNNQTWQPKQTHKMQGGRNR